MSTKRSIAIVLCGLSLSCQEGPSRNVTATVRGQVIDEIGAPVAAALVNVDGASERTDGEGRFQLELPGDGGRHVLTISKDRYQLISRIAQGPMIGVESNFKLKAARNFTIDPAAGVSIVDRPKRVNQRGAEISIAPGSLAPVADRSRATSEQLIASITTIDPADPEGGLPGDGSGTDARGEPVWVASLGAVEVEFRDQAGNLYNLIDGRTATVRIPVDPERNQLDPLPSSALVWFYDVARGSWKEDGVARLAGNFYEAEVRHFSIINVSYPSPDGVTCARVRTSLLAQDLIPPLLPPYSFNVNITVKLNGNVVQTLVGAIDNPLSALYNLPTSSASGLTPRKYTVDVVPVGYDNYQTTFTTDSTNVSFTQTYPYEECRSQSFGAINPPNGRTDVNFAVRLPTVYPPGSDDHHHFLTFNHDIGSQDYATAYYHLIDPDDSKTTFDAWKLANGFSNNPPDPNDYAQAYYFNDGDLGFGRFMNMRRKVTLTTPTPTATVAYYVSNYKDVDDAIGNSGLIATVAMEYSPVPPTTPNNVTKFYVFDKNGTRVGFADLDGNGNKFVPHLCVICHGGVTPPLDQLTQPDLGARFIGFDLKSFRYSNNPAYSRSVQEAQFRTLNRRVLDTLPGWTPNDNGCRLSRDPTDGYLGDYRTICALIEGWYGGIGTPNLPQNDDFIPSVTCTPPNCPIPAEPSSWQTQPDLYRNAVVYCRSCHSTRPRNLDWGTYSLFSSNPPRIRNRVCGDPSGIGRQMPNSQRTWYNFWTSTGNQNPPFDPHGPRVLNTFLQSAGLACAPFAP